MRVSATTLEAYRRVCQTEFGDEAELVAQVKREPFKPSWQMIAGTAWHACLEGKGKPFVPGTGRTFQQFGGHTFDQAAVDLAWKVNGPGTWEVKCTKDIDGVTLVAQADHLAGPVVSDNKAKFSPVQLADYERSLQWRSYLLVHDCHSFLYHCWEFKDPDGGGYCELRGKQSFRFWKYPQMELDVRRWLRQFMAWAESKGLLKYLDREGTVAA